MSKFVKSSVWNIGANLFVRTLSIITYPFLVRYFLKSDISLFKSLQSFMFILMTIIPFGTNYLYISSTKEKRSKRWNLVLLTSLITTLLLVILFSFDNRIINFFLKGSINEILKYLLLILPIISFTKTVALTQLTSNMDFKEISIALIIKQLSLYVLIIVLSFTYATYILLILILISTEILESILFLFFCKKQNLRVFPIQKERIFPIDRTSRKFLIFSGLDQIFIVLALQFPTIFVVLVMGSNLAPEFQLALFAIEIPASLISYQVSRVIFPYLSEIRDNKKIRHSLFQIEFIITLLLIPILFTISFFAKEIVCIVFDKTWTNAMLAFSLLPIMIFASAVNNPFTTIAAVKEKPYIPLIYSVLLLGGRLLSIYIGFQYKGFLGALIMFIFTDCIIRIIRLIVDMHLIKMKGFEFIKNIKFNLLYAVLLILLSRLLLSILPNKIICFSITFLISSMLLFYFEKQRIIENILIIQRSFKKIINV